MSAHVWRARLEYAARAHSCGHISNVSLSVHTTRALDTCTKCGCGSAGASVLDRVPTPDMTWSGAVCSKSLQLKPRTGGKGAVTSLEDLVSEITAGNFHVVPPPKLRRVKHSKRPLVHGFIVWQCSTFGGAVVGSTITIATDGVFLLAGKGAHFRGTTFNGGAVICAGSDFCGTFQECTFNACTLYVVHGASTTLSMCGWRDCASALVAHGPATAATLTGCAFTTCRFCVIAEAGASVAAQTSSFHGVVATAFAVNDPGSHLSAEDCSLNGASGQNASTANKCTWLRMHGGMARMRRCHITDFPVPAVAAGASASLEVSSTYIHCAEACMLTDGARGTLTDVQFRGQRRMGEIAVRLDCGPSRGSVGNARLQLTRCDMQSPPVMAVRVREGGAAALRLCRLRCCRCVTVQGAGSRAVMAHCDGLGRDVCYQARGAGAALRIEGGEVSAKETACITSGEASIAAEDVCFRGGVVPWLGGLQPNAVVVVEDGARGRFLRCSIPKGFMGMTVNCSRVRVKDSLVANMAPTTDGTDHLSFAGLRSAYACVGGEIDVEGGSVQNCVLGVLTSGMLHKTREPVTLRMHGVVLKQYSRGVQVNDADRAEISGCFFDGQASAAVMTVNADGDSMEGAVVLCGVKAASVRDCSFRGNLYGVAVEGDAAVKIEDCTFDGAVEGGGPAAGCSVRTSSHAVVARCRFSDSESAVSAHGPAAACTVRKCVVGAGVRDPFPTSGGANMSVVDCEVTRSLSTMMGL